MEAGQATLSLASHTLFDQASLGSPCQLLYLRLLRFGVSCYEFTLYYISTD